MSQVPAAPHPAHGTAPTFRYAPRGARTVVVVLSLLGLGTAAMLLLLALDRGAEPQPAALRVAFGVVGAVLAVGAVGLLTTLRGSVSSGIEVGPAGIDLWARGQTDRVLWSEVAAVRFRVYLDRAMTPVDLVDRQSYPRIEIAFRDGAAADTAHPLLRRRRSAGTVAEGYTHALDVGTGPFFPRAGIERHLPGLQATLRAVAGPLYQGGSVEKRWFGSWRR